MKVISVRELFIIIPLLSGCIYANRAPGTVSASGGDITEAVDQAMNHCRKKEVDLGMVWGPEEREMCVKNSMGEEAWDLLPRHPNQQTSVMRWIGY